MTTEIIAWHFTGGTLRDGRPIPKIGITLKHDGPLVMCESGLHWSREPWMALRYAPGPLLHKVAVGGDIKEEKDKGVSTERTILASMDATSLLRRFAADQALSVLHLWDAPEIVREYLTSLDGSKRVAARDAAGAAAGAAAWAAGVAARDAARAAAGAAGAAARDAAWDDAWDAARDAAWDVAMAAQATAWDAAMAAQAIAWVTKAAEAAAKDDFNNRVYNDFP